MRSAVVLAFAAGALAVPYKRDVVTEYDVVYATDIVTVWANQEEITTTVAAAPETPASSAPASSSPAVIHYGHNHWSNSHWSPPQSATSESATSSPTSVAPTTPTSTYVPPPPTSTYVPPPPTSTYVPPPPPPTSTYVPPPPTSTYVPPPPTSTYVPPPPPTTTSIYVAPTTSSSTWAAPSAPPPAYSSSAAPAAPTSYQELVVHHHNIHRANHSAPDIQWDDDLAASAAGVAATCIYEHNMNINGGGYGQNIAAGSAPENISYVVTEQFYNGEVGWFDGLYGQDQPDMTNFDNWGHFSQVVWKDTTHVGCATHLCDGPQRLQNVDSSHYTPWFIVCNYKNPGNFENEYGPNIGASLNQPTVEWDAGM